MSTSRKAAAVPATPPATGTAPGSTAPAAAPLPATDVIAHVTRTDDRGDRELVESWHHGIVAVVDPDGAVHAIGAADAPVWVRSAAKPFQAQACVDLVAHADPELAAALTDEEVAVGWASHRGEPEQQAAAERLLARVGLAPELLTCPPARPEASPGDPASRLACDCSGKHALFAVAGQCLGVDRDLLLDPGAALQRHVLAVLDQALGPLDAVGVDGCGAPAVAAPLHGLARGFRELLVEPRWQRVVAAGLARPGLVGGEGRVETALLAAGVVAKVGAEGVYGAAARVDGQPWGVAVKAADGNARGSAVALVALLAGLGAVDPGVWSPRPPLGGGAPVGAVRAAPAVAALVARLSAST